MYQPDLMKVMESKPLTNQASRNTDTQNTSQDTTKQNDKKHK